MMTPAYEQRSPGHSGGSAPPRPRGDSAALVKLTAEETDDRVADLAVHSLGKLGLPRFPL